MRKQRRLSDSYRFPGFKPKQAVSTLVSSQHRRSGSRFAGNRPQTSDMPEDDVAQEGIMGMQRFKNILLVAGGHNWEKSSLTKAVALAEENYARLTVIDIIEAPSRDIRLLIGSSGIEGLQRRFIDDRLGQLVNLIEPFQRSGGSARAMVLLGEPFLEIIREALRNKHDLVIKAVQQDARQRAMTFGSTDMHLLRKCPCPVWIIKQDGRRRAGGIMAAVDPDAEGGERNSLNVKIVELAFSLARMQHRDLHVVHAYHVAAEGMLTARGGPNSEEVERLGRIVRTDHEMMVRRLVDAYAPGVPTKRIHVQKGKPEMLIPQIAKHQAIDIIVMGTISRAGVAGLFIGNTAEKILHQVHCSVLAVKPDGFITPVELPEWRKHGNDHARTA